jgi:hypothetical protein
VSYSYLDGPPPSYAECVFGRGTVALEDEDSANVGNAGFTPRYIYYNNTAQASPLPEKVTYSNAQASNQSGPSNPSRNMSPQANVPNPNANIGAQASASYSQPNGYDQHVSNQNQTPAPNAPP